MANLNEVFHLSRVEEMSGLQSKSRYISKGFIPSGLNLSIGELVSSFTTPITEAALLLLEFLNV